MRPVACPTRRRSAPPARPSVPRSRLDETRTSRSGRGAAALRKKSVAACSSRQRSSSGTPRGGVRAAVGAASEPCGQARMRSKPGQPSAHRVALLQVTRRETRLIHSPRTPLSPARWSSRAGPCRIQRVRLVAKHQDDCSEADSRSWSLALQALATESALDWSAVVGVLVFGVESFPSPHGGN